MQIIKLIFRYFRFLFQAFFSFHQNNQSVKDFKNHILRDHRYFYAFKQILKIHGELLLRKDTIRITDLGAGSIFHDSVDRKIGEIAKKAAKTPKYGQLLFRMVNYYKPGNILELGTSLGISTLYLAMSEHHVDVTTIEGCPQTAAVAQCTFSSAGIRNVTSLVGNFDDVLPRFLAETNFLDFVFFDGNHRKEPTIRYFEMCLPKITEKTIFVFDDIHWSAEMEDAWKTISKHPKVSLSLDLFQLGIIFFDKSMKEKSQTTYNLFF